MCVAVLPGREGDQLSRRSVDFAFIRPEHMAVHERLANWSRWCRSGAAQHGTHPMFNQYRSAEHWDDASATLPIDTQDAAKAEQQVAKLIKPQCASIRWWYVFFWVHPKKVAAAQNVNQQTLSELIHAARDVLAHIKK